MDDNYVEYDSRGDRHDNLSLEEYLNIIRPYLIDLLDDYKARGEWKFQLVMRNNFFSSLDSTQFHKMYTKGANMEIMRGIETNDIITRLFNSLFKKYQEGLETKMNGSSFTSYSVDLLQYIFHKISLNRGGSYIDSPRWIKNKRVTINPQNNDNECFRYAIIAALKYREIDSHPERTSKLRHFIGSYDWRDIKFPSGLKDWKKFEQNNKNIALSILYVSYNIEKTEPDYISKYNSKRDNQVVLLKIADKEKWHCLAVKSISKLLNGLTSNHNEDFYCLNCFHSYRTEKKA